MITTIKEYPSNNRPNIELTVQRVESNVWYDLGFYKYHYMTTDLNKSCKCLLFSWNNVPVAFMAIINQPSKGQPWGHRVSRMVILPNFQGLGLARKILDFCGGIVKTIHPNAEFYMKTIHDNMGRMLERNPKWNPTAYNGKIRKKRDDEGGKYHNRLLRESYCYR